jgi:surfeit locus 1 family protein
MSQRVRKLIVPTLMTGAMLVVLVVLGVWQLQRLAWKEKILANIAAPVLALRQPVLLTPELEMRRVTVFCAGPFKQLRLPDYSSFTSQLHDYTTCTGRNGIEYVIDHGFNPKAMNADSIAKRQFTGTVRAWLAARWFDTVAGIPTVTRENFGPKTKISAYFVKEGPPPDVANISNNHFTYALQWFAFAAVLGIVYGIYARRVWRG